MSIATPGTRVALRNILIATDFGENCQRVVRHALGIARNYGATIHFAHVLQPAGLWMTPPDAYLGGSDMLRQTERAAREEARQFAVAALRQYECESLAYRVWVGEGDVWDSLHQIVEQAHIDLVVVGTHGRRGLRKLLLGSVAERVFRHCPCPVLTIGPCAPGVSPPAPRLKHVLFPTDLTPQSARALPYALTPVQEFGGSMTMLHALEVLTSEAAADRQRVWRSLQERMQAMLPEGISHTGIEFAVEYGPADEIILQVAQRRATDLIVLGLKAPETFVDQLPWMKTYRVVCEAPCPVLTVRGPWSWDER